METNPFRLSARNEDDAVSPVVGTILMVAVTVALGATVLAIMSGVGKDDVKESTNAVFSATSIDTSATGGGATDAIKITYVSGPNLGVNDVSITVKKTDGTAWAGTAPTAAAWVPGDFRVWDTTAGAASYIVTVSVLGTSVVDQTISVAE